MKRKSPDNYDNAIDGKELKKIKKLVFQINEDDKEQTEDLHKNATTRTCINKFDSESDNSDVESEIEYEQDNCEAITEEDKMALEKFLNPVILKDVVDGMSEARKEVSEFMGYDEIEDGIDHSLAEGYEEDLTTVTKLMKSYKKGRLFPKVVKVLPQINDWNYLLSQFDFPSWSCAAVQVFSDQVRAKGGKTTEVYFRDFLLPYVRENIVKNKRLDNVLYKTLQSCLFRQREFMTHLLLPWCGDNITGREAEILGSLIKSSTIKLENIAPTMTIVMNCMEYSRDRLIVLHAFLEKKYNLAFETISCFAEYFHKAVDFAAGQKMPLVWFQALNLFASLYYRSLSEDGVRKLEHLCRVHRHDKVTPSVVAFLRMKSSSHAMDL